MESATKLATQNAMVIFSKSSCCMCHSIKRLFYEQGVSPMIYELDELDNNNGIEGRLGCKLAAPAVFIGDKFVGSTKTVMPLLDGWLKKMLKDAGALWL